MLKPNPQCDDIKRWSFGEMIRVELSMNGINALRRDTSGN
jgi:hypothetical protein